LSCGADTVRTPHPAELFGSDWMEWSEANGAENTVERLCGGSVDAKTSEDSEAPAHDQSQHELWRHRLLSTKRPEST